MNTNTNTDNNSKKVIDKKVKDKKVKAKTPQQVTGS